MVGGVLGANWQPKVQYKILKLIATIYCYWFDDFKNVGRFVDLSVLPGLGGARAEEKDWEEFTQRKQKMTQKK